MDGAGGRRLALDVAGTSRAKGGDEASNEDAYLIDAQHWVFGVFDGVGSSPQGGLAAELAARAIGAAYAGHQGDAAYEDERALLSRAVQAAADAIVTSLELGLTTASVVKVWHGPDAEARAIICNVGDSRVYRCTTTGHLQQCTLDDSEFAPDWRLQLRLSEVVVPTGPLELQYFQRRHYLTRCLGEPGAVAHLWWAEAAPGDSFVALTDGVTDNLTYSEVRRIMGEGSASAERASRRLVDAAYARSQEAHPRAKIDDITAVVATLRQEG